MGMDGKERLGFYVGYLGMGKFWGLNGGLYEKEMLIMEEEW